MNMPTGWCPGSRTIDEMGKLYPGTTLIRVFFAPGEGLPSSAWSDPNRVGRQRLSSLPVGCTVIVSHKDQGVDSRAFVDAWQKYRPGVRLILVAHHEPEQQEGGDPTRAEFRASWTRQREQVGAHPARAAGRLLLAVCYTLQWIRRGNDWRYWWPEHEADAVDLVLGDWYPYMASEPNPWKPRVYEDPAAALKVMVDISTATGKDWGIAEINHEEITKANGFSVDLDLDGTRCADWYRRMHATAKSLGCKVWAHYHQGEADLTDQPAMHQALRDLIAQEAQVTQPEPDPTTGLTREDIKAGVIEALREALPLGANGPAKRLADKGWATNLSVLALLAYCFEHAVGGELAALRTQIAEGFAQDDTDEQAIVDGLLTNLPPEVAKKVADELHARLAPDGAA